MEEKWVQQKTIDKQQEKQRFKEKEEYGKLRLSEWKEQTDIPNSKKILYKYKNKWELLKRSKYTASYI